jgi:hypothetical protein
MAGAHRINFDDLKARADFRAVLLHCGLTIVGSGDQILAAVGRSCERTLAVHAPALLQTSEMQ